MHKSVKYFFILQFVVLLFSTCKKKENTPESSSSTTGSNPTPTVSFNGFILASRVTLWNSGTVTSTGYGSSAYLHSSANSNYNVIAASYQGTVITNGTTLKFDNGTIKYYRDTTGILDCATQRNFQFISSGVLPSFTYSNPDTIPVYSAANAGMINDTLFKSQNLIIPINTVNYHNIAECTLFETSTAAILTKTVSAGVNSITFTPSELSVFTDGNTVSIMVSLKKHNTQSLGGKYFRFESNCVNLFYVLAQN